MENHVSFIHLAMTQTSSNEYQIGVFSDQILSLLPPLWEESGDEHLMKQAILTLLSSLIHSLKQDSARYHALILPLIQSSVHPESVSHAQKLIVENLDSLSLTLLGYHRLPFGRGIGALDGYYHANPEPCLARNPFPSPCRTPHS
jgi:hypothetical protein